MKLPGHTKYLLSPPHMFILKGLRNLTGGFEYSFGIYNDLRLEVLCFTIMHNTANQYEFQTSRKVILCGTVCACVYGFIFSQFHVSA
jgi:hypothetical protein